MQAPGVHGLGLLPLKPLPDDRSGDPGNHLDGHGRRPPRRARAAAVPVGAEGVTGSEMNEPESGRIPELWEEHRGFASSAGDGDKGHLVFTGCPFHPHHGERLWFPCLNSLWVLLCRKQPTGCPSGGWHLWSKAGRQD